MTGDERDLLAELRALRERVGETDDIARESASLLSETVPKVLDLEERVAALRGTVAGLVAAAEDTPAEDPVLTDAKAALGMRSVPPAPWCWPLLDRDQAAAAWEALGRWVGEVFVPTYEITRGQLIECWPRHPRLVAELSALRHGYLEAHVQGAVASKAIDWHTRALPGFLEAVKVVAKPNSLREACAPGFHRGDEPRDSEDRFRTTTREAELLLLELWAPAWREVMAVDLAGRRPASQG